MLGSAGRIKTLVTSAIPNNTGIKIIEESQMLLVA
jgi:hypothetical protein|tara:strand:+ start:438 stop:542 length:105 start_codon:yes stop_codon:yes gene_type:complete